MRLAGGSAVGYPALRRGCRMRMKNRYHIFARGLGIVLALGLTACAVRPVEPPPVSGPLPKVVPEGRGGGYSRTVQTAADAFALQSGSRLFKRQGSPDVDLVGVVHVGEADYFRRLERRLDLADLVLFEGVTDATMPDPLDIDPEVLKMAQSKSGYARLAASHGLAAQSVEVRYQKPRFRRCDLTLQEMMALLEKDIAKGGSVAEEALEAKREIEKITRVLGGDSWVLNAALRVVGFSHAIRARTRLSMVAVGSAKRDDEDGPISPRLKRLIHEDRNAHVVRELSGVLREEPGRKRIAVFYGAGHHADLDRRLRAMGYAPAGPVAWDSAMVCHPYADGVSPEEVERILAGD